MYGEKGGFVMHIKCLTPFLGTDIFTNLDFLCSSKISLHKGSLLSSFSK